MTESRLPKKKTKIVCTIGPASQDIAVSLSHCLPSFSPL